MNNEPRVVWFGTYNKRPVVKTNLKNERGPVHLSCIEAIHLPGAVNASLSIRCVVARNDISGQGSHFGDSVELPGNELEPLLNDLLHSLGRGFSLISSDNTFDINFEVKESQFWERARNAVIDSFAYLGIDHQRSLAHHLRARIGSKMVPVITRPGRMRYASVTLPLEGEIGDLFVLKAA